MKAYKFRFSREELRDLFKAWIAISLAFSIAMVGGMLLSIRFLFLLPLSALTVGLGFLFHELGHKFVAQHYGYIAEFRANNSMLIFAIFTSFMGFVFAAPGAVYILGGAGRKRSGRIAAAGPLINIFLACIFFLFTYLTNMQNASYIYQIFYFGARINAWLGLFNLIPFGAFDGGKVFVWNKLAYAAMLGSAVALLALTII